MGGNKGRKARFLKSNSSQKTPLPGQPRSLDEIVSLEKTLAIEKQISLQKAFESNNILDISKAQSYLKSIEERQDVPIKSMLTDPLDVASTFGYKEKPFQLSFEVLRAMGKVPLATATIGTRKTQAKAFCDPQRDKYSTGFVIDKRNKWRASEKDKKLTTADQKKVEYITEFILSCGSSSNFWHADTFEVFIGKLVEDALTLDQATFEVIRDRIGRPIEFFATDGGTYRIADTFGQEENESNKDVEEIKGYKPAYVQVYQGKVHNQFYPWELCFGVRNPSTNIRTNGYGEGELEILMNTVTSILNSDAYNSNFFKVGSNPKGIIAYSGNINQNTLDNFRQQWQAQVAGVQNAFKTPIINADKINWISTHVPNKDMEFAKFQDFLIKLFCAVFLIDPSEIGFPMSGSSEGNKGLGGDGGTKEKLKYSKDKGLKPLMKNIQYWLNKYIVWQIDPEFEFRFVGLEDAEDQATELDEDVKRVGSYMTVNEIRAKHNLDPIEGGDNILNPVFMQGQQMSMMGNPDSNQAVNDMQNSDSKNDNPFLKSLHSDLERILAA